MHTIATAAAAVGRNKTAILRAIKDGKISVAKDENGEWQIDPAELHRIYPCRFRKPHPLDSRSPANQNMIARCSQLPFFLSDFYATVSSRDDGLKPKSWCCGISSTSCNSGCHVGYI